MIPQPARFWDMAKNAICALEKSIFSGGHHFSQTGYSEYYRQIISGSHKWLVVQARGFAALQFCEKRRTELLSEGKRDLHDNPFDMHIQKVTPISAAYHKVVNLIVRTVSVG